MENIVSRRLSVHQEHEFLMALEKAGLTKDAAQAVIESNAIASQIIALINGDDASQGNFVVISINPSTPLARDMRKAGWKLESNVEYQAGEIALELAEFLKSGEHYVKGMVLTERAKAMGANLGQKHAEALLENQQMISKEWRDYYLVFPGTVWLHRVARRLVPCLGWIGCEWVLCFSWLDFDFRSFDRVLRPRK